MATMTSMNISVPTPMREYIERKLDAGEYGSTSEIVREALRELMRREAQQQLQTKIAEGLGSGPAIKVDDEYWKGLKHRAKQLKKRKTAHGATR